ncbi:MAG TPA: hypothetical protein VFQ62_20660 [Methylomirabilota bacterium]|nr:hypothetical protein [Methylomirabilota bacterium]
MPFRHPDRSHDLGTRIEHEVRERLEEAIDFVCLEALVQGRRAGGGPAPAADNPADRAEYEAHVSRFLRLLDAEVRAVSGTPPSASDAPDARLLARQVSLARTVPDYWQQFETLSARYLAEPSSSSGQRRGVLARLFGRA